MDDFPKSQNEDKPHSPSSMSGEAKPLISVCMLTYNHENYIIKALDSVFEQQTSFELEVVIGVDYSIDKTHEVVEQYARQYPDRLKPHFYRTRVGLMTNWIETLGRCKGEYVAVLSGDDYWIDPRKLQKQAEFLEENRDYMLIGHNALVVMDNADRFEASVAREDDGEHDVTTSDLMVSNNFIASAVMFRNIIKSFPDIYYESTGEDRQLYLLLSQLGKARFSPEAVTAYRVTDSSITSRQRSTYKNRRLMMEEIIKNTELWNSYFEGKFDEETTFVRAKMSRKIFLAALKRLDFATAIKYSEYIERSKLVSRKQILAYHVVEALRKILRMKAAGQYRP